MSEDILKKLKIGYYTDLLIRHRWMIIIIFSLFMIVWLFLAITSPKIYQAVTFIKVIPRSVPEEYLPSVVEEDVGERINTISLEIKSRTNIEKIIEEFKLFSGEKYKNMYAEDKINAVKRNISVNVTKSRKGVDSFTLSYSGDDPKMVTDVVNALAETFINESISVIKKEVSGTKDFLENELNDKAERLNEISDAIRKYREEHAEELPDQLESNLRNLERLQEKQIAKQENLRDAKDKLIQLEKDMAEVLKEESRLDNNLAEIQERQKRITEESDATEEVTQESEDSKRLRELQEQYAIMKSKYTEKHPDMIKIKEVLEQLSVKVAQAKEETVKKSETKLSKEKTEMLTADMLQMKHFQEQLEDIQKQYADMAKQREELIRDITLNEQDIQNIIKQTQMYEKRVENTPKVELKLRALERDLKPIQKSYDSLLEKREDAVVAVKLEEEQKVQKFRIVDKAKKPEKPVSPNIKKLFLLCAVIGLGLGIGLTVGLDFLDTSLRRPEDSEEVFDVPVLVTIPKILMPKDRVIQKIKIWLSLAALMIAGFLFVSFGIFAMKGIERTLTKIEEVAPFLPTEKLIDMLKVK